MEFITQADLDTIVANALAPVDDDTFADLKKIYGKLETLCQKIAERGFEYHLRKDPRKMAGQGAFEFQEYQWARIWPRGLRTVCESKFAYIVGLSNTLHFHIMGVKGYMGTPISRKCSEQSWKDVALDGSSYDSVADQFVAFDAQYYSLFLDCGIELGISSLVPLKQKVMNDLYIKILEAKGQIILQGPPGTGKTYQAQEIAYQMVFRTELSREKTARDEQLKHLKESDQFQLVQFHPAYTYEDFVRGISAKTTGEKIAYEVEDRLLAELAKKALNNWEATQRQPDENAHRQQVAKWIELWRSNLDERLSNGESIKLTDGTRLTNTTNDGIRYNGNNDWKVDGGVPYRDLLEMYLHNVQSRDDIKSLNTLTPSAKSNSTYWWYMAEQFKAFLISAGVDQTVATTGAQEILQKYVLVIDEINRANLPAVLGELIYALEYRNTTVASLYDHPFDGRTLRIPPNLYIIGTMNTADRSVGHIDYAIRRRFAFVDVLPNESVIDDPVAKGLFEEVDNLFHEKDGDRLKYLSGEFEPGQVRIGHSYFLASGDALRLKLEYEIKPILREYVRDGILNAEANEQIKKLIVA